VSSHSSIIARARASGSSSASFSGHAPSLIGGRASNRSNGHGRDHTSTRRHLRVGGRATTDGPRSHPDLPSGRGECSAIVMVRPAVLHPRRRGPRVGTPTPGRTGRKPQSETDGGPGLAGASIMRLVGPRRQGDSSSALPTSTRSSALPVGMSASSVRERQAEGSARQGHAPPGGRRDSEDQRWSSGGSEPFPSARRCQRSSRFVGVI
jgi:hypothetical protein